MIQRQTCPLAARIVVFFCLFFFNSADKSCILVVNGTGWLQVTICIDYLKLKSKLKFVGSSINAFFFFIIIFRCDTVTNAVMMQYSRDFKGHLASLFLNENINLGKKYVFDIRRTAKEVYDHARRALYNSGVVDLISRSESRDRYSPSRSPSRDGEQDKGLDCGSCQQSRALQERLQKLREALLCMLCCEEEIDAAFCPCGHMVCCQTCANQLQVRISPQSHVLTNDSLKVTFA